MTEGEDEELRVLRERAYGPAPDIHLDPLALQRLRELEGGGVTRTEPAPADGPDHPGPREADEGAHGAGAGARAEDGPRAEDRPEARAEDGPARRRARRRRLPRRPELLHRVRKPRRSTVLIALGVGLFAVAALVTVTVVQRVQTDPLQVGATQIARLPADPSFPTPTSFNGGGPVEAYQDFHGVRALVVEAGDSGYVGTTDADAGARCLVVYQPDQLSESDEGYSYSGQLFVTACEAGAFPAAIAFTITETSPQSLRDSFAPDTALQFVYDSGNDEVVVFQG